MLVKSIIFFFLIEPFIFSANDDPNELAAKLPLGFIKNATQFLKQDIIDRIRESREKEKFREALSGGYSIYLDEQRSNRMNVAPVVIPYKIKVTEAVFRAEDGKTERENATRSAISIFDGELEKEVLVRKRTFGRDEFGRVDDPAKGVKKLVEILYDCMDHNGKKVGTSKKASAPEMRNVKLSCKDIPSYFGGEFKSN